MESRLTTASVSEHGLTPIRDLKGSLVLFLRPEEASQVGLMLVEEAKKARRSQLIVPNVTVDPNVLRDLNGEHGG